MAQPDDQGWTTFSHKRSRSKKKNTGPSEQYQPSSSFDEPDTVVFNKRPKQSQNQTYKKSYHGPNSKLKFVNDENALMKSKKYSDRFRQKLINIRQKNHWSQKELANKLNVKESVIKEIENGTGIYNSLTVSHIHQQIQKYKLA